MGLATVSSCREIRPLGVQMLCVYGTKVVFFVKSETNLH